MKNDILIATIGLTDPIRSQYDGPVLHIVRWYRPRKVFLILTEEMAKSELDYHQNEEAIHLLDANCEVELINTGVRDAHSYDDFPVSFLKICNQIKEENPDDRILLNITSGTPQMETAMCMIAISDPVRFCPIQVTSPARGANHAAAFNPAQDLVEEWFENDLDNLEGEPSRCHTPKLLNFRRPIIQMQINSLIENYDYAGACQLYEETKEDLPESVGLLLEHAKYRVNLEHKTAEAIAARLNAKEVLYPVGRSDVKRLIEFFNSMKIKQARGELNDFALRLEIMAEELGIYILKDGMKISLDSITKKSRANGSYIMRLDMDRCIEIIPGIDTYLDAQFPDRGFDWSKPLNSRTIVHIITFLSKQERYTKYAEAAEEMQKWVDLSAQVRNPAAHTIVAITDEMIRDSYGKDSAALCRTMQQVLRQVFGPEANPEAFDIYNKINDVVKMAFSE